VKPCPTAASAGAVAHGVKRLVMTATAAVAATGRFPRRLRRDLPYDGLPNRFMGYSFREPAPGPKWITDPLITIRSQTLRIG
jgi:hypothetical protein